MSTGYSWEGIRQVRATLLGARHVPERLCGGYVYLGRYISVRPLPLLAYRFIVLQRVRDPTWQQHFNIDQPMADNIPGTWNNNCWNITLQHQHRLRLQRQHNRMKWEQEWSELCWTRLSSTVVLSVRTRRTNVERPELLFHSTTRLLCRQ